MPRGVPNKKTAIDAPAESKPNQNLQAQLDVGGVENVRPDGTIKVPVQGGTLKKSDLHKRLDELASRYPEATWEEQTTSGVKGYRLFTHCYRRDMRTGQLKKRMAKDDFGESVTLPRETWLTGGQSNEAILAYAEKFFNNPT